MKFLTLTLIIVLVTGCLNQQDKEQSIVTIKLAKGALVTLEKYSLLDGGRYFKIGEKVAVELDSAHEPSSLRHAVDVSERYGKTYVATTCCGSYRADVIYGEVIKTK